jgi:hypothetical protein
MCGPGSITKKWLRFDEEEGGMLLPCLYVMESDYDGEAFVVKNGKLRVMHVLNGSDSLHTIKYPEPIPMWWQQELYHTVRRKWKEDASMRLHLWGPLTGR